MDWETYKKQNSLYLGADGLIHTKRHGETQYIRVVLPLSFILSHRCGECEPEAAAYERIWKAYNIAPEQVQE